MLRADNQRLEEAIKETMMLKQILGLIYEKRRDFKTLDWVIRLKMLDAVTARDLEYNLAKYLHIENVAS